MTSTRLLAALVAMLLTTAQAVAQPSQTITITDNDFSPQILNVTEGTRVTWVWAAVDPHNVHAGRIPGEPVMPYESAFISPLAISNFSFSIDFDRAFLNQYDTPDGDYHYFCEPHYAMGMRGIVRVTRPNKEFRTLPRGIQVVPPNGSSATADCSVVMNGWENYVDVTCTSNLASPTSAGLYNGIIGENGSLLCNLNLTGTTRCPLTREEIDYVYNGETYIQRNSATQSIRGQIYRDGGVAHVRGSVFLEDGTPVPGVLVQAGAFSATTGSDGAYDISNVANGYYVLQASKSGYIITANAGSNPAFVNSTSLANRNFTAVFNEAACTDDTDEDGVCDEREILDSTDPTDPGSYRDQLKSPIYVLWNGFLNIRNIIEIVNRGDTAGNITVALYDVSGTRAEQRSYTLSSRGQVDVILNDWQSFASQSYGLAAIEFSSALNGKIDGRISYYRDAPDLQNFEFAFAVPFTDPVRGQTSVAFNTFQPSLNAAEQSNLVAQWLGVVNLGGVSAKRFDVRMFTDSGTLISERVLNLPPFGRADIEAGHENPGPSRVGLIQLTPEDSSVRYVAQLFRYGGNAPAGFAPSAYRFAFPLLAKQGNGSAQVVPISTGGNADNWLEVANTLAQPVQVELGFYGNSGALLGNETLNLAPRAQRHLYASAYVPNGASGSARIAPQTPNSVIGQSMFYFRNPATGQIQAMYGSQMRSSGVRTIVGSYNLFLNMYNWLRVTNVRNQVVGATLSIYGNGSLLSQRSLSLAANGGIDLGLHETGTYGTSLDSYGTFILQTDQPESIFAELLRLRPESGGLADFAAPILVR